MPKRFKGNSNTTKIETTIIIDNDIAPGKFKGNSNTTKIETYYYYSNRV